MNKSTQSYLVQVWLLINYQTPSLKEKCLKTDQCPVFIQLRGGCLNIHV